MIISFWLDHSQIRTSGKGNNYAVIYARSLTDAGEPDWQQHQFMSYSPDVIELLRNTKDGQKISLDLEIKEAVVQNAALLKATAAK